MGNSSVSPETTIAVILGAGSFPKTSGLLIPAPSFQKSAEDFRNYLLSPEYFNLPEENLLYLFDSVEAASRLDERVREFLSQKISTSKNQHICITDIIVYYVGHGGFAPGGSEYYLALSDTNNHNPLLSSYAITALATTLKGFARNIRRYVILDCCFSASAYKAFMSSGPGQVATQQASKALEQPGKGTALLCASSSQNPAMAPEGESHTMFSGAMLDVLHSNAETTVTQLSFKHLQQLIVERLHEKFDDVAVRPEIHFPNQPSGDIGDIPFFPNQYHKNKEQQLRLENIEKSLSNLQGRQEILETNIAEIRKSLDHLHESQVKIQKTTVGSATLPSTAQKKRRVGRYVISEDDWKSIPLNVKKRIGVMQDQFITSMAWSSLCLAAVILDWVGGYYITNKFPQYLFTLVSAIVCIATILALTRKQRHRLFIETDTEEDSRWMHLDVVLAINRIDACEVIPGCFVDRRTLSLIAVLIFPPTSISVFLTLAESMKYIKFPG
jgi:uncharacterized caspase-like protein